MELPSTWRTRDSRISKQIVFLLPVSYLLFEFIISYSRAMPSMSVNAHAGTNGGCLDKNSFCRVSNKGAKCCPPLHLVVLIQYTTTAAPAIRRARKIEHIVHFYAVGR
ncbi:hypothetical protein F4604DRAFT_1783870 [Suillus subluteus]|nr:hypothetical protein F4604DRAFT_1783870 [Suillus subluteus]